jgi:hypothetical protein
MKYRFRVWLYGLLAATLNGVANSVVLVMVDPMKFNLFQGGARELGIAAAASAVFAFFTYLKTHPLPDPEKDVDYAAVSQQAVARLQSGTGDGTRMLGALLVLLLGLGAVGCGGPGPVQLPQPSPETANHVRVRTYQAVVAAETVITYANEGGKVLRALPVDVSVKNAYDCALAKAFGSATPAPASVIAICGPIPLHEAAPFTQGMTSLRNVTTCPGLATASGELLRLADPWVSSLERSDNPSAAFIAFTLRTTLNVLRQLQTGATPCSE